MKLPEKQFSVLAMLASGRRDDQIAESMMVKSSAVRATIHRAVKTLGARTRCEAVAIYVRRYQKDG